MNTLQQFALANWQKLCAWLVAGGAVWCLDQLKESIANGTVVVPAEWQAYVPLLLTLLTFAAMVLTPSHRDVSALAPAAPEPVAPTQPSLPPSQPTGTR